MRMIGKGRKGEVKMAVKAKYNDEQLKRVGDEFASFWGGIYLGHQVLKKDGEVIYRFTCKEHGDVFVSDLKESEIETDYACCL